SLAWSGLPVTDGCHTQEPKLADPARRPSSGARARHDGRAARPTDQVGATCGRSPIAGRGVAWKQREGCEMLRTTHLRSVGSRVLLGAFALLPLAAASAYAQSADTAAELYRTSCAACHGHDGRGAPV